jgi:hypothetical protein
VRTINHLFIVSFILYIAGCNVEEIADSVAPTDADLEISGSVGDGPIINAEITVYDAQNNEIVSGTSDNQAHYSVRVPQSSAFPLLIKVTGGIDLVTGSAPDFELYSVIEDEDKSVVNITPFSTLIVYTAQSMAGGLTISNISQAQQYVTTIFNFGLDVNLVPDVLNSSVTINNVANVVKANEGFAEFLKRTQQNLEASSVILSLNEINRSLAGDIADGKLDGVGVNTDVKIAAISSVTAAQVSIELLINELKVNGSIANLAMEDAIRVVMPTATNISLSNVPINSQLLSQTIASLNGAYALSNDPIVGELITYVQSLATNTTASMAASGMPAGTQNALTNAINMGVTASVQVLDSVNTAVNDSTGTGTGNGDTGDTGGSTGGDTGGGTGGDTGGSTGGDTGGGTGGDTGGSTGGDTGGGTGGTTLISNFTVSDTQNAADWSVSYGLQSGITMYGDRSYTIDTLPASIVGSAFVQTANDSKSSALTTVASFTVQQIATVYVAHRDDIVAKPTWLAQWQDTNLDITNSEPTTYSLFSKTFAAGETVNLGANGDTSRGMYVVIVGSESSGGGSNGNNNVVPVATSDSATTQLNTSVNVNVLQNDSGLDDSPYSVSVLQSASNGSVVIESDNTISYSPNGDYQGNDSFVYKITDANNDFDTASVFITINCDTCASGTITLDWNPNADVVSGYEIYAGPTESTAVNLIKTIPLGTNGFNANAPSIQLDPWNDLGLQSGDQVCFRMKAYNIIGKSDYSVAACAIM